MKTTANYIVLHPSAHKTGGAAAHRALLAIVVLVFIFTLTSTLTTRDAAAAKSQLSEPIATPSGHMSPAEIESIASVLRRCGGTAPCNLLIFGLTQDTLFWNSVNRGGRTVFVGDNSYFVSKFEEKNPSIEAYDVQFTTRAGELYDLIEHFKREIHNECRPVQNLLFSDCKLAVNDLPNHLYDVAWDVILIDGPRGYSAETPGRMAPIFTAGVLARSGKGGGTHVFVHEIEREVEKVCSDLFLCRDNLEEKIDSLGHFVVGKMDHNRNGIGFCSTSEKKAAAASSSGGGKQQRRRRRQAAAAAAWKKKKAAAMEGSGGGNRAEVEKEHMPQNSFVSLLCSVDPNLNPSSVDGSNVVDESMNDPLVDDDEVNKP